MRLSYTEIRVILNFSFFHTIAPDPPAAHQCAGLVCARHFSAGLVTGDAVATAAQQWSCPALPATAEDDI